jgi:hypothetical protein
MICNLIGLGMIIFMISGFIYSHIRGYEDGDDFPMI